MIMQLIGPARTNGSASSCASLSSGWQDLVSPALLRGDDVSAHPRDDGQAGNRRRGPRPGPVGVAERGRGHCWAPTRRPCRPTRSSRSVTTASRRTIPWREPRVRRPARRGRRAVQEGGGRGGRPALPQQAALFREAQALGDLALVEPDRVKEARDKLYQFIRTYPQQSPHRGGTRGAGQAPDPYWRFRGGRGDHRGPGQDAQGRRTGRRAPHQGAGPAGQA